MISQKLLEIEQSIRSLSLEEQKWLLECLERQIEVKIKITDKFADKADLEKQIKEMADNPEIQAEIAAINQEFAITEMDGLAGL